MEQRGTGDESREEECEKLSNWASRTSQPTPVPHRALERVVPGLLHILPVAFTLACSAVQSGVLRGSRLLPSSSPRATRWYLQAQEGEERELNVGNTTSPHSEEIWALDMEKVTFYGGTGLKKITCSRTLLIGN